jgi:RNA polymerase sigma factor (sigma-70 family)
MLTNLKDEYSSEAEIRLAIAEYNKDKKPEEDMRYCSYFNSITRKRMYVPCTIEYFHSWRNMLAEEHRQRDNESRCLVPSERYSYMKRCQEDCNNCPFGKTHRDGKSLSLDQFLEDNNYEMADIHTDTPHDALIKSEREEALERELSLLDEESRMILNLFNDGCTDDEIGKAMGLKRSTVQYKKSSLIKTLQEKLKDYI